METGADRGRDPGTARRSRSSSLLEYARLSDEMQGHPAAATPDPRGADHAERRAARGSKLWRECDGASNLGEMADRLGWPLYSARRFDLVERGYMRCADAPQMELCQRELAGNRLAPRRDWRVQSAAPGPPTRRTPGCSWASGSAASCRWCSPACRRASLAVSCAGSIWRPTTSSARSRAGRRCAAPPARRDLPRCVAALAMPQRTGRRAG